MIYHFEDGVYPAEPHKATPDGVGLRSELPQMKVWRMTINAPQREMRAAKPTSRSEVLKAVLRAERNEKMNRKDYQKGREDGLAMAMEIVQKGGVEALEREIRFRNLTRIRTPLDLEELNQATDKIKRNTISTVIALTIATLMDEFGLGKERIRRFRNRFDMKAECVMDDLVTWSDLVADIEKRAGIDLDFSFE